MHILHQLKMEARSKELTLLQILADPKNRETSGKFFRFSFLMLFLPIAFLVGALRTGMFSTQSAGIAAVILVNIIMMAYAVGAYRDEVSDYKTHADNSERKKNK